MKRTSKIIGLIVLMALLVFLMVACGGGASPSSVVRKAITAIEKGDQKGVEATFTPEAAALIVGMLEKAQGGVGEYGGIASTEETINGDTAKVKVTFKNGETGDFDLVKVDGKWKITMGK